MPKNSQKVAFKRIFFNENGPFLPFFVIICIRIAATNFLVQLRGVCWYWWLDTCIKGCLALVSPAQVLGIKRNVQNAPQGHEIIERAITR